MLRIRSARIERLLDWDRRCTRTLHRGVQRGYVLWPLRAVSRLADGLLWYLLILAVVLLAGESSLACALDMTLTGATGVAVVHWMKHRTARLRPYQQLGDVRLHGRALDHFSFPSGHAVHAAAFTAVAAAYYPALRSRSSRSSSWSRSPGSSSACTIRPTSWPARRWACSSR